MARYNTGRIRTLLRNSNDALTDDAKGRIFEDLVIYLFSRFNGIRLAGRNILDAAGSQEIDVALWNNRQRTPLDFLDPIVLIECKNEDRPLSSAKCREFVHKLRTRGATSGILISKNGITGHLNGYRYANAVIMDGLSIDRIKILVLDGDEILALNTTDELSEILSNKFLQLTLRRANL